MRTWKSACVTADAFLAQGQPAPSSGRARRRRAELERQIDEVMRQADEVNRPASEEKGQADG